MGKKQKHKYQSSDHSHNPSPSLSGNNPSTTTSSSQSHTLNRRRGQSSQSSPTTQAQQPAQSLFDWCYTERHGLFWVISCALLGALLGLGIGTGHLTGAAGKHSPWRKALAAKIRNSFWYEVLSLKNTGLWTPSSSSDPLFTEHLSPNTRRNGNNAAPHSSSSSSSYSPLDDPIDVVAGGGGAASLPHRGKITIDATSDPDHPRVFQTLREMVIREEGGYVHPDLGVMIPAPGGASRGIGMVTDRYTSCEATCNGNNNTKSKGGVTTLLRVPLEVQMTRAVALRTLHPLLSHDTRRRAPLEDLDDAALLVLLLSHERGRGRESYYQPYVASLPREPTCGYSPSLRDRVVEIVRVLGEEMGLDVNGWPSEIRKAADYAERIAGGLTRDYGSHIAVPRGMSAFALIQWSICQVASRATAGREEFGGLRLVPIVDMINHDADAGGMVELIGTERIENGDFIDATEDDAGTFIIRSLRHGRLKPLKKGQELLVNYNVPQYSPLDWFISLGFIPPERAQRWVKIDAALPRIPTDAYHHLGGSPTVDGGQGDPGDRSSTEGSSRPEL